MEQKTFWRITTTIFFVFWIMSIIILVAKDCNCPVIKDCQDCVDKVENTLNDKGFWNQYCLEPNMSFDVKLLLTNGSVVT
jgi:hypothetical protein